MILMEQFLRACPRELALFVRERSPKDFPTWLTWPTYLGPTNARMAVGGRPKVSNQPSRDPSPQPEPRVSSPQQPRKNYGSSASNRCFLCHDPGHRAAYCPTGKPRPCYEKYPAPPGIPNHVRGNAAVASFDHKCSFHEGKAFLECGCSLPIVGSACTHGYNSIPLILK